MHIVVIGSINMDVFSQVESHPRPGETVKGADFKLIPGGKGSNQAIAACRLGGDVHLLGCVGNDAFGDDLLTFLKSEGMDIQNITRIDAAPTGAAFVAVDAASENVIYVSGGANDQLSVDRVKEVVIEPDSIVLSTLETPLETTRYLFEKARAEGAITVLNAAPAILESSELFLLCDYLIINETELATFANVKAPSADETVALMKDLKGPKNIITTLGKEGVVALVDGKEYRVKGKKVQAVDTTGAGDCFVGAFIFALSEGREIETALNFANDAAVLSVQKLGASSSMPTRGQMIE